MSERDNPDFPAGTVQRAAAPAPARAGGRARRLLRGAGAFALVLWFVVGSVMLLMRVVVMPAVGDFRAEIAAVAGDALGLPVSIASIEGDFAGWRPRLHLAQVSVADAAGRPGLLLPRVDATLAWSSLLRMRPYFERLEIFSPQLALRREADGRVVVGGLALQDGADDSDGSALEWLLGQGQILVHDARLSWTDELRGAPELQLDQVEFRLLRDFGGYRFGLRAAPPAALASTLDVRGEVKSLMGGAPLHSAGRLYVALDHADLGGWQPWFDYPLPLAGSGGVRAWIEAGRRPTAEGEVRRMSISADVALDAVRTRLGDTLPGLELARADGRISISHSSAGFELGTRALALQTGDGLQVGPIDLVLQAREEGKGEAGGELRANRLDFGALAGLAAYLPFDDALRSRLAAFAPQGEVRELRFDWRGDSAAPEAWTLAARFAGIGLAARDGLPGLGGLSGEIDGSERGGRFRVDGRDAHVDLPEVFESSRLAFDALRAEGGWQRRDGRLEISLDSAEFDNVDAAGNASGRYWPESGGAGEIDLQARLTRAEGTAVWRYLPRVVGSETHDWVRAGIRRAVVPEARLRLRGRLEDFPFRDGNGQFLVAIQVADAVLDYAPGWPSIGNIHGEVRFEGPGMRIEAARASILGVSLAGVVADVPDLDAPTGETMTITGRASGPSAEFLRFVAASPVAEHIGGFTAGMQAEGAGTLDLRLVLPLRNTADTRVRGEYRFAANRLWLLEGLPALEEAAGRLVFTTDTLSIPEARAQFLGAPLRVAARTAEDGTVSFEARGGASIAALSAARDWPALSHLSGSTPWQADIRIGGGETRMVIRSELSGVSSSLPAPLNKGAAEAWPLRVELAHPQQAAGGRIDLQLADRLAARLESDHADWSSLRGGLRIGTGEGADQPPRMAERGVLVAATFDTLDADAWRRALGGEDADDDPGGAPPAGGFALPLAGVTMQAAQLRAFDQTLRNVSLRALTDAGGWKARLDSDVAAGEFDWRDAGDGALVARFRHLALGGGEGGDAEGTADRNRDARPPRALPGLDVAAERFSLRGIELGRLEVFARNRGGLWVLERLALTNPDGRLSGKGEWQPAGRQLTRLDFSLDTPDVGRFTRRLGYVDSMRGGAATLAGEIEWRGAPTRIHYPTLAGNMRLDAADGQFNKLEPGVGRLLGILSLQSLPRRITLDFRDVFSDGFAFDRISGSIRVASGVMHTDDLEIRGPAARVKMQGSTDIEAETQDLRVLVQPTLSESVAIGAAASLLNPVAGVVTYLAQKVLSDPIERLFAFEYTITGTWDDPLVLKRGFAAPPVAAPAQ